MTTFHEWSDSVKAILPSLSKVASENGLFLNQEAAVRLLDEGEYLTVYAMVQSVCEGLQTIPCASMAYEEICELVSLYPHEEPH